MFNRYLTVKVIIFQLRVNNIVNRKLSSPTTPHHLKLSALERAKYNILNYLTMQFVKIPNNGATWQEPLCYTIDTEGVVEEEVIVEIVDDISGAVIGRKRLYGISTVEVDIAPYLRSVIDATPSATTVLSLSPSARRVSLRIGDVQSESRVFFHGTLDGSTPQLLSSYVQSAEVACGDIIRLTAYSPNEVSITVTDTTGMVAPMSIALRSQGLPVEIAIPTLAYSGERVPIRIDILGDGIRMASLSRIVVAKSAHRGTLVVWYNIMGGIESYTFPTMVRQSIEARVIDNMRLKEITICDKLVSGYELSSELQRISGVILSPEVFECNGTECSPLKIVHRRIDYDDHGALRRVELNIESRWRA